jgi:hypothetical protein
MKLLRSKAALALLILISLTWRGGSAAKYAGESFALGVGGRGMALGGAVVAGPFDGTAPYWNPAGLNRLEGRHFTAMHAEMFGDLLNHDFLAFTNARRIDSSAPAAGLINNYGFYVYYLGGDGIKITDLDGSGRPYVVSEESHGDWLVAGAVSGRLFSRIDIGLAGRIIYRDLGIESGYGLSLDAGALYRPHRYLQLGLVVSDITTGVIKYDNSTESIYPTVKPGLMIEYPFDEFTGRAMVSGDVRFEGREQGAQYWSGPISLDTHFGWELDYRGMLFGRFGFDIGDLTAGVGVIYHKISFDFAYLDHDAFDETFRVSAGYQF